MEILCASTENSNFWSQSNPVPSKNLLLQSLMMNIILPGVSMSLYYVSDPIFHI